MELDLGPEIAEFRGGATGLDREHDAPDSWPGWPTGTWPGPAAAAATGPLAQAHGPPGLRRVGAPGLPAARLICPQWPAGVRRPGPGRGPRGRAERGVPPGRGAAGAPRHGRDAGRAVDHRARHAGAEGPVPAPDHLRRRPSTARASPSRTTARTWPRWRPGARSTATRSSSPARRCGPRARPRANMMFVLCRTDPDVPKHDGPLLRADRLHRTRPSSIRPIKQMSGAAEFCEDFFDGVRAPLFNVIGGLNNGWRVAMTTLGHERGGRATRGPPGLRAGVLGAGRDRPQARPGPRPAGPPAAGLGLHPGAADAVQRPAHAGPAGGGPGARPGGLGGQAVLERVPQEARRDRRGHRGPRRADPAGRRRATRSARWQNVFLSSRAGTIYSGTSEIQRNIIGERVLGLPKEPRVAADLPLPQADKESDGPARPARGELPRLARTGHAGAAARVLRPADHRPGRRVRELRLGPVHRREPARATGFTGPLIPVHPGATTAFGRPAVPSLRDLAEPVDLAFILAPIRRWRACSTTWRPPASGTRSCWPPATGRSARTAGRWRTPGGPGRSGHGIVRARPELPGLPQHAARVGAVRAGRAAAADRPARSASPCRAAPWPPWCWHFARAQAIGVSSLTIDRQRGDDHDRRHDRLPGRGRGHQGHLPVPGGDQRPGQVRPGRRRRPTGRASRSWRSRSGPARPARQAALAHTGSVAGDDAVVDAVAAPAQRHPGHQHRGAADHRRAARLQPVARAAAGWAW